MINRYFNGLGVDGSQQKGGKRALRSELGE
jgi:hypothetical protein